jgi:glycosyltransferase involved in cell wall biosynthesis
MNSVSKSLFARRIVFVISSLGRGGAEAQLYKLATRLSRHGWKVAIISLLPLTGWSDDLHRGGIEVFSLEVKRNAPSLLAPIHFAQLIRRLCPDIVHAHMVHANLLARICRPFVRMPVLVCTVHSMNEGGRLREWLYRVTDSLCDLTTHVSKASMLRYQRIGASRKERSLYIPNGIDAESFRQTSEDRKVFRREFMTRDGFMWLAVGRIEDAKDYQTMVMAFAHVVFQRPESILVIAGAGASLTSLQALTNDCGLSAKVRFLGMRDDVPRLLDVADGFVMSSKNEGLPMALLEAAAAGLPMVATDVGGVSEIVIDSFTGFLVSPNSPGLLAEGMLRLISLSSAERMALGQNAREHVRKSYDIENIVSRWEVLYEDLFRR